MPRKNANRAAVSNGTRLLPGSVDGRSRFARRYRDLVQDISADLGGAERLSTLQHQLIRRAAALASQCELIEADIAAGRPADLERFASAIALLTRVSRQLGLQRIARDITGAPDLRAYLAARERVGVGVVAAEAEAEAEADADAPAPSAPPAGVAIDRAAERPKDEPSASAASPELPASVTIATRRHRASGANAKMARRDAEEEAIERLMAGAAE
jgi:hypothetical protein